jgi:hypothetical protein
VLELRFTAGCKVGDCFFVLFARVRSFCEFIFNKYVDRFTKRSFSKGCGGSIREFKNPSYLTNDEMALLDIGEMCSRVAREMLPPRR